MKQGKKQHIHEWGTPQENNEHRLCFFCTKCDLEVGPQNWLGTQRKLWKSSKQMYYLLPAYTEKFEESD